MKLYVWEAPYDVSYGHSMVFAVADSLDSAKEQARKGSCHNYDIQWDESRPDLADYFHRRGVELGEPTRVVELPCAEWHEWSE